MPDATPYFFTDDGSIPNNPTLPMLVYPAAVDTSASPDLLVVGAYPPGPDWDLYRGGSSERRQATANIARVPLPRTDPVGGATGPVIQYWLQR